MFAFKSIVLIAAAYTIGVESSAVAVPAAPLVASAAVGYAHAVPQNIPPYASQVSVVNRALNPLVAAPVAAPLAAAPFVGPVGAPLAAPYAAAAYAAAPYAAAPYAAAPYFAGPAPFAAPYAAPYSYGAAAPLVRAAPYGFPAFVR